MNKRVWRLCCNIVLILLLCTLLGNVSSAADDETQLPEFQFEKQDESLYLETPGSGIEPASLSVASTNAPAYVYCAPLSASSNNTDHFYRLRDQTGAELLLPAGTSVFILGREGGYYYVRYPIISLVDKNNFFSGYMYMSYFDIDPDTIDYEDHSLWSPARVSDLGLSLFAEGKSISVFSATTESITMRPKIKSVPSLNQQTKNIILIRQEGDHSFIQYEREVNSLYCVLRGWVQSKYITTSPEAQSTNFINFIDHDYTPNELAFYIINEGNKKALSVIGSELTMADFDGSQSQQFAFTKDEEGRYMLFSLKNNQVIKGDGVCLRGGGIHFAETPQGGIYKGAELTITPDGYSQYSDRITYQLRIRYAGFYKGIVAFDNTQVKVEACDGSEAASWRIMPVLFPGGAMTGVNWGGSVAVQAKYHMHDIILNGTVPGLNSSTVADAVAYWNQSSKVNITPYTGSGNEYGLYFGPWNNPEKPNDVGYAQCCNWVSEGLPGEYKNATYGENCDFVYMYFNQEAFAVQPAEDRTSIISHELGHALGIQHLPLNDYESLESSMMYASFRNRLNHPVFTDGVPALTAYDRARLLEKW